MSYLLPHSDEETCQWYISPYSWPKHGLDLVFVIVVIALKLHTGFSSEIGTKLRDWAVGQAGGSCYSRTALPSNDSKTRYARKSNIESIFLTCQDGSHLFSAGNKRSLALRRGRGRERNEYMRENRAEGESEVDVGIH